MGSGGRPKATSSAALTAHVALRLTEAERLDLIARATAAGYPSLSRLCPRAFVAQPSPPPCPAH